MIIDKVLGVRADCPDVSVSPLVSAVCLVIRGLEYYWILTLHQTQLLGGDTARRASCPAVINTPPTRATRVTTCQHTRGKVATIEFLQTDIFIIYGVFIRVSWSWDDKSGSRELEFQIKEFILLLICCHLYLWMLWEDPRGVSWRGAPSYPPHM